MQGSAGGLIGLLFFFVITRLPDMPAYVPLIGVGGIFGTAHDSGKDDWGGKGKGY